MEIRNKPAFEASVRKKLDKFIKEFPFHFTANIIINMAVLSALLVFVFIQLALIKFTLPFGDYHGGILILAILIIIFRITFKSFLRNVNILRKMIEGNYRFGIEKHEMENAIEFIEDLPMPKDEVERMKISLSFGKLIDVLEAARIISCDGKSYDIDILFKYANLDAIGEKIPEADFPKKYKHLYGRNWRLWR